jgi:tRNA threonylcarbamoyladenosine biosynthesis protein TsaB
VLIVGIDTSGRNGSVALARAPAPASATTALAGGPDCATSGFDVIEVVPLAGGTYSAELIPQFSALLARHGLGKQDVDAFAVATGPGSFTGLRVGISTVKGLAEILKRPVAAVSVLEAIAAQTNVDGRVISPQQAQEPRLPRAQVIPPQQAQGRRLPGTPVIAALDAGRKELYVGEYEVQGARAGEGRESLLSQVEFTALLERNPGAELITPDGTVVELAAASMHLKVKQIDAPDSGEIARLGWLKICLGETTAAEALDANYIRRSDAEIFSKP